MKIIIDENENLGQRLDLLIAIKGNKYSRSQIKNYINDAKVLINGVVEYRPHYRVKKGDIVELIEDKPIEAVAEVIEPVKMDLDIVYEDKDLIIINKPIGMVTHPATGHQNDTLMNGIMYYYKSMDMVGDNKRSGLIHRLDKDTSGVILVGKTNLGLWHYSRLFAEKKIEKTYIVVVKGDISAKFKNKVLNIKSFHGRNTINRKKFSSKKISNGKIAETNFEFIRTVMIGSEKYSVVLAHPRTGRTHQIRVHLSELGYPLLGDVIYGKNEYKRLMLHAWKIKLNLINGEERTFEAPIPADFKPFIDDSLKSKE
jgi:23S rRNA pseudouridine1911/1915/1917 synthase